jgi:hypothetical protein
VEGDWLIRLVPICIDIFGLLFFEGVGTIFKWSFLYFLFFFSRPVFLS